MTDYSSFDEAVKSLDIDVLTEEQCTHCMDTGENPSISGTSWFIEDDIGLMRWRAGFCEHCETGRKRKNEYQQEREKRIEQSAFAHQLKVDTIIKASKLPAEYQNYRLSTWPHVTESEERSKIFLLARQMVISPSVLGIYMSGSAGVGKTGLAAGVLLEKAELHIESMFQNGDNLFATMLTSFSMKDGIAGLLQKRLSTVPFLVLDDLGNPNKVGPVSDWVRSLLFAIIEARKTERLQTIITSNIKPEKLSTYYDEFLVSRLQSTYHMISLRGNDLRKKLS